MFLALADKQPAPPNPTSCVCQTNSCTCAQPCPAGILDVVKLIIAIIQPTKLSAVREALVKIEVTRMTVCDAQGFGRQRGRTEMFRGNEYTITLLRKVALEIFVNDDFLDRTLDAIINTARTGPEGTIGDGKIFVLPADQAIQMDDGSPRPWRGVTLLVRKSQLRSERCTAKCPGQRNLPQILADFRRCTTAAYNSQVEHESWRSDSR